MKLKQKSWYAWYYQNFYGEDLPVSLCVFFWKELLAIILFPITWLNVIFNYKKQDYDRLPIGLTIALHCVGIGVGLLITIPLHLKNPIHLLWVGIPGLILLAILIGIVVGVGFVLYQLVGFISRLFYKYKPAYKEPKPSWFKEGIKAFFGKYCPKIDWL